MALINSNGDFNGHLSPDQWHFSDSEFTKAFKLMAIKIVLNEVERNTAIFVLFSFQ